MTTRLLLTLSFLIATYSGAVAEEATIHRTIGDRAYNLRLEFHDDFTDLDQWVVESTGKVRVRDNWLEWDCFSEGKSAIRSGDKLAGTIWCRKEFSGPTVVEFDAVGEAGARNLNFILYATHPDGLLATTGSRSGEYGQYHKFSNYIVTYLTPPRERESDVYSATRWRIRFRKNPGFKLLGERQLETRRDAGRRQQITIISQGDGRMQFLVDGELLVEFQDKGPSYRSGHFGFRTWNSKVKYADFKIYSIHER